MNLHHLAAGVSAYFKKNILPGPEQPAGQVSVCLSLKIASNLVGLICRWTSLLGMLGMIIIMLIITVDVILRIAINQPIKGSVEIAELLMLPAIFLIIGLVQHLKANIAVDVLFNRFPLKMQPGVELITTLLSFAVCCLILRQALVFQQYLVSTNNMSTILKLHTAPFHVALVAGYVLISLVFLIQVIESVLKVVKK